MSSISKHFISGEDNGALGQHEQTEWQILNGLLQRHGFKPIQLMAPLKSKNQNDAILLDKESAVEIREVVKSLIKDTERRQALIWDLVQSNKKLKKDECQQQSRTSVEKLCMSDLKQVHDTVKSESPEVQDDYFVQCCQHQNQLEQLKHDNQDIQVYCDELEHKLYEQEKTIVQLQKRLYMVVTEEEKCIERCKLLEQTTRTHTRPNKQWFEAVDAHKTQTSCLPQELSAHKKIENVPSAQKGEYINIRKYLIPHEIPEDDKWEMACDEHLLETNFKNHHTLQNNQNHKQALKNSSGCCVNKKLNGAKVEDIDCLPEATCKELLENTCKEMGIVYVNDLLPTLSEGYGLAATHSILQKGCKSASPLSLEAIVSHFQKLFDVSSLSGVYPRMNEVYSKLGELNNAMRNLREILGFDESTSVNMVVNTVGKRCSSITTETCSQVHQLLGTEDIDSIINIVEEHAEFFPAFYTLFQDLLQILEVDSIDHVLPAVHAIKLQARKQI
ncbi:centrosomal protein of 70 kDa isoform X1 [Amblyraja radiata]|uniref:centrosomal protein of 70 kDa isoform X1 n=1 Tax=Amblyraja radiata TaxID=386614 RepID=UPI0014033605|nr:centrosomal protein of 70 kDa isoform X1 [Amblyraja radiata]